MTHTSQSTQSPRDERERLQQQWQCALAERALEVQITDLQDRLLVLRHTGASRSVIMKHLIIFVVLILGMIGCTHHPVAIEPPMVRGKATEATWFDFRLKWSEEAAEQLSGDVNFFIRKAALRIEQIVYHAGNTDHLYSGNRNFAFSSPVSENEEDINIYRIRDYLGTADIEVWIYIDDNLEENKFAKAVIYSEQGKLLPFASLVLSSDFINDFENGNVSPLKFCNVIQHEFLHIMGLGNEYNLTSVRNKLIHKSGSSCSHKGPETVEAWANMTRRTSKVRVPMASDCGHWDMNHYQWRMFDDLFFPFALEENNYLDEGNLSAVNVAALYDLGFYVDWSQYDDTRRTTRRGRYRAAKPNTYENPYLFCGGAIILPAKQIK